MFYGRKIIFRALALLLAASFLAARAEPARGQAGLAVEDPGATVRFGETITFHARIKDAQSVKEISLLFRGVNEQTTYVERVQPGADGLVSFTYDASLNTFPPFSEIAFWFQATLIDGSVRASETMLFAYEDNRFPWRTMSNANMTTYWYAGNDAFGAQILDTAAAAALELREIIPVSLTDPIRIYVYSNPADLQATLALGGKDWVGGHAIPKAGVTLAAIPPEAGSSNEIAAKIPHELTHVLLYRALGEKYYRQPTWLVEGLAAMMEQYPDPEYQRALDIASNKRILIDFNELCNGFPPDSGRAYLAYAQSQSFVKYIYESYGASGLSRLTGVYGDGVNCELGATSALGIPLSQLDTRWRENVLGQNVAGVAMRNLAPYVAIMALVLIVPLWGMIDLVWQRKKREEQYAQKPKLVK